MVTNGSKRQGREGAASRPIVAFDFDGTLTVEDSFIAFLRWRAGAAGWALAVLRLAPQLILYPLTRDRGALKAAAARLVLGRIDQATLEREAEAFAAANFDRLIRPDALARWRRHTEEGALMTIVTASPETIVAPFAKRLGADRLIGTCLGFDAAGRFTGGFDTANCRAAEKVARLRQAFGEDMALAAAYGDTSGDTEMLAFAAEGHMKLFKSRPAPR